MEKKNTFCDITGPDGLAFSNHTIFRDRADSSNTASGISSREFLLTLLATKTFYQTGRKSRRNARAKGVDRRSSARRK